MRRNIFTYATKGHEKLKKADRYSLTLEDLQDLTALFHDQTAKWGSATSGAYQVIVEAYAAGFEAGTRCERRKHK